MRARARLFLHRFENELFIYVKTLEAAPPARKRPRRAKRFATA